MSLDISPRYKYEPRYLLDTNTESNRLDSLISPDTNRNIMIKSQQKEKKSPKVSDVAI